MRAKELSAEFGIAGVLDFRETESGLVKAAISLGGMTGDNDVGAQFWPEPLHAIYTVTFARPLPLRLAIQNRATHPITFEEALHDYFAVSDVSAVDLWARRHHLRR